jgi:hypothetical protein
LRSPSTTTGVTVPFMVSVSRMRSAVASAVRRIVETAEPSASWWGLKRSGSVLNQSSLATRSGSLDFRWATNTSVSGGFSRSATWKLSTGREKCVMATLTSGVCGSSPLDCSFSSSGNELTQRGSPRSRPLRASAAHTILRPFAGVARRSYVASSPSCARTRSIASRLHSSCRPTTSAFSRAICPEVHSTLLANSASVQTR